MYQSLPELGFYERRKDPLPGQSKGSICIKLLACRQGDGEICATTMIFMCKFIVMAAIIGIMVEIASRKFHHSHNYLLHVFNVGEGGGVNKGEDQG